MTPRDDIMAVIEGDAEGAIVCGDALTVMQQMPPDCVHLVFGSPPYEDARTYGMDFKLKGQEWVDWMVAVVEASLGVCSGLVAFVVNGRTRKFNYSSTPELLIADLKRKGICVRKPPKFHRVGIPGSGGPDWLRDDYETIVCATNGGKLPWSDNTAMGHPVKWAPGGEMSHRLSNGTRRNQWGASAGRKLGERRQDGSRQSAKRPSHRFHTKRMASGDMATQGYVAPAIANPGNIIHCNVGGGQMGHPLAHENEAPFPEPLAEFFIRSFCPPEAIVLDPFGGSGTTAAVAKNFGRRWINIDIRESQCKLAGERIHGPLFAETSQ